MCWPSPLMWPPTGGFISLAQLYKFGLHVYPACMNYGCKEVTHVCTWLFAVDSECRSRRCSMLALICCMAMEHLPIIKTNLA